ncbi:ABC transporter ATP-binding protein [Lentibacillus saliphilus]|uniref:ABC transporter ATP-binding protein n=1 Tax=Lentibacillus saliphilus TaxID=2737028 RepID=UPI001C30DAD6|nr:ABC transporter ATP-binding protein [Lentibacillus saliphilus]
MTYIELSDIQHYYKQEQVLRNVALEIPKGQLFGLLGPSGSGKTTLVKIMIGLLEPKKGEVLVNQVPMPSLEAMQHIGYMAQSDALYNELTARENLDFFASLYKMKKKDRSKRIEEVAAMVDLTKHLDKTVEHFSGGMKRRMSLAVALIHEPDLLILDEPTVGIDPVLRDSIWSDLKKLQQQGTTIVITTHVMDEAEKCNQLGLLRDGYIIAQGSPDELRKQSETSTLEAAFLYYGQQKSEV